MSSYDQVEIYDTSGMSAHSPLYTSNDYAMYDGHGKNVASFSGGSICINGSGISLSSINIYDNLVYVDGVTMFRISGNTIYDLYSNNPLLKSSRDHKKALAAAAILTHGERIGYRDGSCSGMVNKESIKARFVSKGVADYFDINDKDCSSDRFDERYCNQDRFDERYCNQDRFDKMSSMPRIEYTEEELKYMAKQRRIEDEERNKKDEKERIYKKELREKRLKEGRIYDVVIKEIRLPIIVFILFSSLSYIYAVTPDGPFRVTSLFLLFIMFFPLLASYWHMEYFFRIERNPDDEDYYGKFRGDGLNRDTWRITYEKCNFFIWNIMMFIFEFVAYFNLNKSVIIETVIVIHVLLALFKIRFPKFMIKIFVRFLSEYPNTYCGRWNEIKKDFETKEVEVEY